MTLPADHTVRAPAAHRALAAVASPVIAYFVARLVLRLFDLPAAAVYAVCLGVGLVLAVRAWRARVDLEEESLRVHNTLLSSAVPRADIRRVNQTGRIEWHASAGRATRAPAEALHRPVWTFGAGEATYHGNREVVRTWLRAARRRAGEQESYTDVIPVVRPPEAPDDAS